MNDLPITTLFMLVSVDAELMRAGLIDSVSLVVAPIMVGGSSTPSLLGGKSLETD